MSAVTASIIVGTKHRTDTGIQPRWLLLLHEGRGYAWHLIKLQLTAGDVATTVATTGLDDPPGVLWQAGPAEDLVGEMALLVHLIAARTPEFVHAAVRVPSLRKQRVDLAALEGREAGDLENLLRLARERGRELTLAATILPGSRLTEQALFELPDWELNVAHTAITRDWHSTDQRLSVTDLRLEAAELAMYPAPEDEAYLDSHDDHPPVGAAAGPQTGSPLRNDAAAEPAASDLAADMAGHPLGGSRAGGSELADQATHGSAGAGAPRAGLNHAADQHSPRWQEHDSPAAHHGFEGDTSAEAPRGRFGRRGRRRPVIGTVDRQRVGLADLFGRSD